ncbi:histidine decarboxylase [Candidatus Tokpelaia sp.]|uniref:histidine decarboxylase n=1 Tax=Candidatus Tokpelaia sp. TaxID=2233777 RepID=UPI001FED6B14|nr:histidine decarboxylase [Candidatus Tokpelaia sp.]
MADLPMLQNDFYLDPHRLSPEDTAKLDAFYEHCMKHRYFNIGYPESYDFDYSDQKRFLDFHLNNCGAWDEFCNYQLQSFPFEKEVIEYFAGLFKIPFNKCWGYVTNGGTEGNMWGIYIGREKFPEGTLFYSRESHYSVAKIAKILRLPAHAVLADEKGEMVYSDLIKQIKNSRVKHPIILANIGTTVKGAIDNIATIQQKMTEAGFNRQDYYIHCDEALSGMVLPFVDDPQPHTFADGADSLSVSGHKNIGAPMPCGIALAKKENVDSIKVEIDYIACSDKTMSGSRNGHTVLYIWEFIKKHRPDYLRARVANQLALVKYTVDKFRQAGIPAWTQKNSVTVVFPKPSEEVWQKHNMATAGGVTHFVATCHQRNTDMADAMIADVVADFKRRHIRF